MLSSHVDHLNGTFCRIQVQLIVDELVIESRFCSIVSGSRIEDSLRSRPVDGSQTHRTRLATGIKLTSIQLKCTQCFRCLAYSHDFSMSRSEERRVGKGCREVRCGG